MLDPAELSRIVDGAPDAVIVVDERGLIAYWNDGAERIFGHARRDALGQSLDMIIPDRLRERHWSGFNHAVATGESRYGPGDMLSVPARRSDGATISIDFTVSMVEDDGAVKWIGAVLRDVTARRAQDRELRQRLAELEGPK